MDSCHGDAPVCWRYVQSWTSPRKPERTSARLRIAMPVRYVDETDVDWDGDADSVVHTTPIVTTRTESTWWILYLCRYQYNA